MSDSMKFLAKVMSLVFVATLCASRVSAAEQSSFDLKSPDKRIEVRIRTAHGIHYDVVLEGRAILEDSTLSMDVDHKTLGKDDTKVVRAKATTHDEVVEPVVRQKFAKIRDHYNEQRISTNELYQNSANLSEPLQPSRSVFKGNRDICRDLQGLIRPR